MIQRRTLLILALAYVSPHALAQSYYPEASLVNIYSKEQIEQKKAEDLEKQAVEKADLLERQKREVEHQVEAHRFAIENLKVRQEKAQSELDMLNVELQHVNGDLASYQAEHQQLDESVRATMAYLNDQRSALADRQAALTAELDSLGKARKTAEHDLYMMGVDIERWKTEVAKTETKIQEAETKRAQLEADEMKVRGEWLQTKMAAAEHMKQRDEALANMNEAKKRWENANKDMAAAKVELAKAEKQRNEVSKNVQMQVGKYEHDIQVANKNRINAEAERIRLDSEMTKLQEYAIRVKDTRDQAVDQQDQAGGAVMKSSLALESARTVLASSIEGKDQASYKAERTQHQQRGLAAAEEASKLVGDGGRFWVTTQKCTAYTGTNKKKAAGLFNPGSRVMAKDHGSHWVQITDGAGSNVFVESHCGKYEE